MRKENIHKRIHLIGRTLFFFLLIFYVPMLYGQSWDVNVFENNTKIDAYSINSLNFKQDNPKDGDLKVYSPSGWTELLSLENPSRPWVNTFKKTNPNDIVLEFNLNYTFRPVEYITFIRADDGFEFYHNNNKISDRWDWSSATGPYYYVNKIEATASSTLKIRHNNKTSGESRLYFHMIDAPQIDEIEKKCEEESLPIKATFIPMNNENIPHTEEFIWHLTKRKGPGTLGRTPDNPLKAEIPITGNTYRDFNLKTDYPFALGFRKFGEYTIKLERKITIKGTTYSLFSEEKDFNYGIDGAIEGNKTHNVCLGEPVTMSAYAVYGKPPYTITFKNTTNNITLTETATRTANPDKDLASVNHTFNNVGNFEFVITVKDSKGCERTLDSKYTINVSQRPTITQPAPATLCMPKITSAKYENNRTVINSPQYELKNGDTSLDVSFTGTDCCTAPVLKWQIIGKTPEMSGQPSSITTPIILENNTNANKEYTIKYWLQCGNKKYSEITRKIIVTPRPTLN